MGCQVCLTIVPCNQLSFPGLHLQSIRSSMIIHINGANKGVAKAFKQKLMFIKDYGVHIEYVILCIVIVWYSHET